MGSFLLAAGEKGKRYSLPNSRIMVHQPSAGFQGQATDIEIHAKEKISLKERLNNIYSKHTGKSINEISIQAKYGDERSQLHIKYAIMFFFNTLLFFLIKNKIIKSNRFR